MNARKLCLAVSASLFCGLLLSAAARAEPAPSRERAAGERQRQMRRIERVLAQEAVRSRLAAMGMSQEEILSRLERLNDRELADWADRLDEVASGGSGAGVVIALLVIAVLVLLAIYLSERV